MTWTQEKQRAYMKKYYAEHKDAWNRRSVETPEQREARLAKSRAYQQAHRAEISARKKADSKRIAEVQYRGRNLKKYGLTPEIYQATVEAQDGECAICQKPAKLVVDHCHASGRVRALLCTQCNTALGLFQEDASNLHAAIAYLETWRKILDGAFIVAKNGAAVPAGNA